MVEGRIWRAGSKNRDQLLMDAYALVVKGRHQSSKGDEGVTKASRDHPPSPMLISPLPLKPTREAFAAPQEEEESPLLKTDTSPTIIDARKSGANTSVSPLY